MAGHGVFVMSYLAFLMRLCSCAAVNTAAGQRNKKNTPPLHDYGMQYSCAVATSS